MLNKNTKDFYITADGDISIDGTKGDIKRVDSNGMEIFRQHMVRRLMTNSGDFALSPDTGANLGNFVGLPNNAETGSLIKSQLIDSLVFDNLFASNTLDLRIFPLSETSIAMFLITRLSSLEEDTFSISFSYDLRDNKIIPRRI